MNPQLLFAHFDRTSDAPDAIPRLRRFVLDLAVRGKLVEQDPNDEPASELLKRIQTESVRLIQEGKIKKQVATLPVIELDKPFSIPTNWAWTRLGQIGDWGSGSTPPRGNHEYYGAGITWLKSGELNDNQQLAGSEETVTELAISRGSFRRNQPGDVLIAMYGATIGRVAILAEPAVTNQAVCGCSPFRGVFNRYLFIFVLSQRTELQSASEGGAQPNISKVKIVGFPFPLAPLPEQHRIVAKVDELMALCDRLEAAQAERERRRDRLTAASDHHLNNAANAEVFRTHAHFYVGHLAELTTRPHQIKHLRQTIINLAVQGKLVPQDHKDEPASQLLKRMQAEKARLVKSGAIQRLLPMFAVEPDKILSAIPGGWEWVRIGDLLLGDSQNGYSKKPDDALDGIPILRISAGTMRKDGVVAEEEHKLIGGVSATKQDQYELQPGDLLACRFNGNRSFVGRLSLFLGYLGIKPIYPDKLIRLRLLPGFVLPKLVRYFAESNVVRKDIESYCATTVGNWGISASNLKDVKMPLPPFPEQHRIISKVDELMGVCDQLEAELTTAQAESGRLLEAIFYQALNENQLSNDKLRISNG